MTDQLVEPKPRMRIDPRFRQRRIEVKREEGRRRLRGVVAVAVVLGLLLVTFIVIRSPLAAVRHVHIVGASHTTAEAIARAAGVAGRPPMFDVNPGSAAAAIRRLPWVDRATVRRQWPATVDITVTERVAVAVVGIGVAPVMVDAEGRVLGPPAGGLVLPAIVADGDPALGGMPGGPAAHPVTAHPPGVPGTEVDPLYAPGLAVAAALTPTLLPRLTKIVVSGDGTVRLGLLGGGAALLGPADGVGEKLVAVETLLDHTKVGSGTIDLTVPSAPVVTGGAA